MKKLFSIVTVLFFFVFVPHLWAQPHDEGSIGCGVVQKDVQEEIGNWDRQAQSHGEWVQDAGTYANGFLTGGQITTDCYTCIVYQFATTTMIVQQESCGIKSTTKEEGAIVYRVGNKLMIIKKSIKTGDIISVKDENGIDATTGIVEDLTLNGDTVIHAPDDIMIETHGSPGCYRYFYRGKWYRICD